MTSSWIICVGPKFNDQCPYIRERQRQKRERHRHRGDDHVKTEAETRVMLPQAKEAWSQQKLEEARKDFPLEPLREPGQANTFISVSDHQVGGSLLQQP